MCGIAGAVDLTGQREFPVARLRAMTDAILHRGPDEEGLHVEPGVALGNRRLAIVDVAHGQQPMSNETDDVWVAYEGELYHYPELRERLLANGHTLRTHCDTEAWVHLYEEEGERVVENARGQFGVALWDRRERRLILGRDRIGIAPMFYAEADGWLLFGSEIKSLLASGLIDPRPDRLGVDFFFNMFAHGGERTCFQGVKQLSPGCLLKVENGSYSVRRYWDLDYPDHGEEREFDSVETAVDEYEGLLRDAVKRRLCGEAPLCCYISGGLDSTTILGLSSQEHGSPLPAFTIGLEGSGPNDERSQARQAAEVVGSPLTTVAMTSEDIASGYPAVVRGAEFPVFDTSTACTFQLAAKVRENGRVVSLTGEGADESLAGYVWFKAERKYVPGAGRRRPKVPIREQPPVPKPLDGSGRHRGSLFDFVLSKLRKFVFARLVGRGDTRIPLGAFGGLRVVQQATYEMMAHSRNWFYTPEMWEAVGDYDPFAEMEFDSTRMRRWHPLNRSLYVASKVMLPGMLLSSKGDRALKHGSTEGRFPFLDERVVDFCAEIDPDLKLRGTEDKYLLRQLAKRVLPPEIAGRKKTMFRANFARSFLTDARPSWIDQLLSEESLRSVGMFDPAGVAEARRVIARAPKWSMRRFVLDMGLVGVVSTQLWHHVFCGGGLADVPNWEPPSERTASRR